MQISAARTGARAPPLSLSLSLPLSRSQVHIHTHACVSHAPLDVQETIYMRLHTYHSRVYIWFAYRRARNNMYACAFISFARVHMRAHIYHLRVYMSFASRRARNDMYACTYTSFENARALPLSLSCAYTHTFTHVCVYPMRQVLWVYTPVQILNTLQKFFIRVTWRQAHMKWNICIYTYIHDIYIYVYQNMTYMHV